MMSIILQMSPLLMISCLAVLGQYCCWDLNLVHVNDIHVRMEETNKYSAACRSSTFDLKTLDFAIKYSILFRQYQVYF